MKTNKSRILRVLAVVAALVAIVCVSSVSAFAAGTDTQPMTLTVSSQTAFPGDTIEVTVDVSDNPGITSLKFDVQYGDYLTLTDVKFNSAFGSYVTTPTPYKNPQPITFLSPLADVTANGNFVTLTFTVAENAPDNYSSEISIIPSYNEIYDTNFVLVSTNVVNGGVNIIHRIFGDINADRVVDTRDAILLFRYVAEWDVEVDEAALDITGDGLVDTRDAILLFRYVAGWDIIGHTHTLVKTDAKSATCTEGGNIEYWQCTSCNKYFSDENASNEITLADTVLGPNGHDLVYHDAKEPTLTEKGWYAYETCNNCDHSTYQEKIFVSLEPIAGKWAGTESIVNTKYEFVIEIDKIASAKYGETVMNVTSFAFDGTTLTVNYTIEGVADAKTITFTYADNKLTCDAAVAGGALELSKMLTVYVDYNGASTTNKTVEVAYGASYKLSKGSYTGHNFIGWTINGVFVATTASTYTIESVTEDTTVVAEWEKKSYTVKFYDQDYNVIKTLTVLYGDVLAAEDIPTAEEIVTKEGYTFSGNWATSKTSTTAQDLTKPINNAKSYYPIMIEPQVPVGTLAGTWTGTEVEDNSYPAYDITDIRTREYTFVIDAEGNITAICVETIDNGEDGITGPIEYTDCVVSDVTFNGTTLKLTVTYKEGSAKKTYTFTYDAEAETLTKSASFVLTKQTVHEHTIVTDKGYAAMCGKDGLTDGSHCSECGETIVAQEVIPAIGHNYVGGVCTECEAFDDGWGHGGVGELPSVGIEEF